MQKTLLAGIWIALVGWMLSPLALAATAQEITDLKYMRSEEKRARDLYAALYTKWKDPLFDNISQSEQRHMDAVLGLLTAYGVSDPDAGLQAAVLPDAGLQSLYNQLLAQGTTSVQAAAQAGISVEETGIAALEQRLARTTDPAIIRVYNNLVRGSRSHIQSFTNHLLTLGGTPASGNSVAAGTAVFEPISQTLYIPAINVTDRLGTVRVYDALLRLVETVPPVLELLNTSLISKLPSATHASYNAASGLVTIPALQVGALTLTTLETSTYQAVLQYLPGQNQYPLFVVTQMTAIAK